MGSFIHEELVALDGVMYQRCFLTVTLVIIEISISKFKDKRHKSTLFLCSR